MKKLLTVLSSIAMISVTAGSVVACGGNNYDKKDSNGDSILIDGLGNLNFTNGKTDIVSSDILDEILENSGDSTLRNKIAARFMNLMSAGFLIKGDTNGFDFETDISKNPYLIDGLAAKLKSAFNELKSSIESDIKTEREKYDTDYGKKAASKWKEMLEAKFPGVTDLDELESKYKEYQMLNNTDDNVNTRILNILLNTNQQGITWVDKETLKSQMVKYLASTDQDKWIKDNEKTAQQLIWSTMSSGYFISEDIATEFKEKVISDTTDKFKNIQFAAPESIDKLNTESTYAVKGFLSNSQRFFLDKYYETEAPVAISQATLAFTSNGKMDDGIDASDFDEGETASAADKQIVQDENAFLGIEDGDNNASGDVNSNIDKLLSGETFDNVTKGTTSTLLTLSDSTTYSQMLRNVVYDYINGAKNSTAIDGKTKISDIATKLTRSSSETDTNTTMYGVMGDGIVCFIDASGLQIIRIEGYSYLKTAPTAQNTGIIGNSGDQIDPGTLDELSAFKQLDQMSDAEKVDTLQNNQADLYQAINKEVSNPYLHYLVNASILNGVAGAKTSFDILTNVKDYVKIETTTTDTGVYTYRTGIMDYFYEIQNAVKDEKTSFADFYNSYFVVGDGSHKDAGQKIIDESLKWVESMQITEKNDAIIQFINAQKAENKTISDNEAKKYPKGIFTPFNETDLQTFITEHWEPYSNKAQFVYTMNSHAIMAYLKGGLK